MQVSPAQVYQKISQPQREAIVAKFTAANPHWSGARFDDILDTLDNSDANLPEVESAWEAYPTLHCSGFGTAVRALLWSGGTVDESSLQSLLR